ncbi:unnamed protein product [Symbiodinium necroappetens]|uniref:Uncharacterized protein n=1 Tax=Symbiodinium necroappetens TaxID=1628268 RepID=A0A812LPK0_9DINO|nr:unnamed protein product [Symbiodinium necroappetens]
MEQAIHGVREQHSLLASMVRRQELFVPMLGIWVASFGGALHAPVTTYFQVEVGASTAQIGNFGIIRTAGVLLVSPLYGWLLDRRSAYLPAVLSAFCCTFGCLMHGFAPDVAGLYFASVILALGAVNFWNVVGAYVALATPREQRHVVVTGFQVQVATLRLIGTSLYPAVDSLLKAVGIEQKLLRYRIHMSECSIFCVFAFVYLVVRFQPAAWVEDEDRTGEPRKAEQPVKYSQIMLLLVTSVIQTFGETVITVLWPLHIRKLGLGSHDYAWLQLLSQLLIILSTLGYPPLTRLLGHRATASSLPMIASATSALAFLQPDASLYGQLVHISNVLTFLAVCGTMKVCYQHLTTLAVPASQQGRVFSLLNVLGSVGNIAGNLVATRFSEHETSFTSKGATPFLVTSSLFCTVGCAIVGVLCAPIEDGISKKAILQTLAESPGTAPGMAVLGSGPLPPPPPASMMPPGQAMMSPLAQASTPAWTGVITLARNMAKKTPFRAALIQGKVADVEIEAMGSVFGTGAAAAESTESAEMPPSSAAGSAISGGGAPGISDAPRWLRRVRCAVPLPAPTKQAAAVHSSPGRVLRPNSGLVFARCAFSAPSAPDGPCIVVERALVDTGSSDCELREGLLRRLPELPIVERGVMYETSTGGEAYDAYEVVATLDGHRCAAVLTVVPEERFQAGAEEPCSDEALLGHMAIAALGLMVDCPTRRLVPKAPEPGGERREGTPTYLEMGQLHVASSRPWAALPPSAPFVGPLSQMWSSYRHGQAALQPRWLPGTGCAMPLMLEGLPKIADAQPCDVDPHGSPIIPVTYVHCMFMSPFTPEKGGSFVNMALVDTGSSDCELRESYLKKLGPLPTVAAGVVYETVAGRHVFDSYEVLVAVGDRVSAVAVTGIPEAGPSLQAASVGCSFRCRESCFPRCCLCACEYLLYQFCF